jgi:Flp pilus assembly pilin Flp
MMRLRKLAREESGAAIIELALVAPVIAVMIIGVSDISIAYGRRLELEQAVQRSIEKVMQTTGDTTVDVTVTYRLECTNTGGARTSQETSDSDTFDAFTCPNATDSEARYILANAVETYTPMFKIHFGTGPDGVYNLSATAGVRVQ